MPTKHRRHAVTETPRVKEALDPLREELDGERVDLAELVILGAEAKLSRLRSERDRDRVALKELTDMIRNRQLHLDPDRADEARRSWLPE